VPLNGFKELEGMNGFSKFSIHRDYGNKERLPSSHTCFNREIQPLPFDFLTILRTKSQSSTFPSMRVMRISDTSCTLPLRQEASISGLLEDIYVCIIHVEKGVAASGMSFSVAHGVRKGLFQMVKEDVEIDSLVFCMLSQLVDTLQIFAIKPFPIHQLFDSVKCCCLTFDL
jgi:hypothetical protein